MQPGEEKKKEEEENEEKELTWAEMSNFGKFIFIIDFPLDWVRKITMPPSEVDKFSKILCFIWPFPGIFTIFWILDAINIYLVYIGLPLALIISCFFFYT